MTGNVSRFDERNEMVRADALKTGDLIDLQNDPWADPDGDPAFEGELALVSLSRREGNFRWVYTDQRNFTCPPDHLFHLCGHDNEAEVF